MTPSEKELRLFLGLAPSLPLTSVTLKIEVLMQLAKHLHALCGRHEHPSHADCAVCGVALPDGDRSTLMPDHFNVTCAAHRHYANKFHLALALERDGLPPPYRRPGFWPDDARV